ncbi:hypothetical protein SAMN04488059_12312 [Devosia psychrophila]|uniref:Uncharacterized protein n=1 Tax=Devosia psychrophila TaxID=728005 RepID=A0A1I1Q3G7_9HYPH|nr:hypothetical protein SAMN04488059_12312 [Devosia psychrophila]
MLVLVCGGKSPPESLRGASTSLHDIGQLLGHINTPKRRQRPSGAFFPATLPKS